MEDDSEINPLSGKVELRKEKALHDAIRQGLDNELSLVRDLVRTQEDAKTHLSPEQYELLTEEDHQVIAEYARAVRGLASQAVANLKQTTMKEDEQPQRKIERSIKPEQAPAPVLPALSSGEVTNQVIFDMVTSMKGELQEIRRALVVQAGVVTELARRLNEVSTERDCLLQEKQAELERKAQEELDKRRHKQDLSNARTRKWREQHPEEVRRRRSAERARQPQAHPQSHAVTDQ